MSSVDAVLPLNWLVSAARLIRSADFPSALRVTGPIFNVSSQKTTKIPCGAAENGTKPTLMASDISNFLQAQGLNAAAGPVHDIPGSRATCDTSATMAPVVRPCQAGL